MTGGQSLVPLYLSQKGVVFHSLNTVLLGEEADKSCNYPFFTAANCCIHEYGWAGLR